MICSECHKEFDEPLMLYDGCVACPACGKTLASVTKFAVTDESEERFQLSETYFFHAIELSNANINHKRKYGDSKKIEEEWRECINNAVMHCRVAAASGHPLAIWRMGFYYDKDYTGTGSSEAQRCIIAASFYASLINADEHAMDGTKYMDTFAEIRRRAANDFLVMLYNAPEELLRNRRFNYNSNRQKLVAMFGGGIGPSERDVRITRESGDVAQELSMLNGCFNKKHVPLFGLFYVTRDELAKLIDKTAASDPDRVNDTIVPFLGKNIYFVYFPCKNVNRAVSDEHQEFYSETDSLDAYLRNQNGGYICFINSNTAHMSDKRLPAKVKSCIIGSDYTFTPFKTIINYLSTDGSALFTNGLTFYCDDIIRQRKLSRLCSYGDAVEKLCESVRENNNK